MSFILKEFFTKHLQPKPALYSWPFIVSLFLLLANDFILKAAFSNTFTGKLSDFCGLYAFAFFFSNVFPQNKKFTIHLVIAMLFILWKSPLSEPFIHVFSKSFFTIDRVIDYSDLWALFVLPVSYFMQAKPFDSFYKTIVLSLVALISFTATSHPRPTWHFFEPQYLLFKNTNPVFVLSEFGENKSIKIDSLLLVRIKEINLDKYPELYDDFQQKALLENLEKAMVYESDSITKRSNKRLSSEDFYNKRIALEYRVDSCLEKLSFLNARLHGAYIRYINEQVEVSGFYKNGIPDSVWTYYTDSGSIAKKDIYEKGEKIKSIDYSEGESSNFITTRHNKKIIGIVLYGLLCLILLAVVYYLWNQYKKATHSRIIEKILYPFLLPVIAVGITFVMQSMIPGSDMLEAIRIQVLFLVLGWPLFFIIYFAVDKHSIYTFLLLILIYIILIMLVYAFVFINGLKEVSQIQ